MAMLSGQILYRASPKLFLRKSRIESRVWVRAMVAVEVLAI